MTTGKILILALCATMLAACAEAPEENTASAAGEAGPVSELFAGAQEMEGAGFEAFTMPEHITLREPEGVYIFTLSSRTAADREAESRTFFSAFFGDGFDESAVVTEEDGKYIFSDPRAGWAAYGDFPYTAYKAGYSPLEGETVAAYDPASDREAVLELEGGSCTVGEICDTVQDFTDAALAESCGEIDLAPTAVYTKKSGSGGLHAYVECGEFFRGIPLENSGSHYRLAESRGEYDVVTDYAQSGLCFSLDSGDNIYFFTPVSGPAEVSAEPIENAISLQGAVDILREKLAQYSGYCFERAELIYSCLRTYPQQTGDEELNSRINEDYYGGREPEDFPFVPTWCFSWTVDVGGRTEWRAVKVNALTGEVTLDFPRTQ